MAKLAVVPTLLAAAAIVCAVFSATSANANTITITPQLGIGGNTDPVTVSTAATIVGLLAPNWPAPPAPVGSLTNATGFPFAGNPTEEAQLLASIVGVPLTTFTPGVKIDDPGNLFDITAQFFAIKQSQWIAYFFNATGGEITLNISGAGEGGISHITALSGAVPGVFQAPAVPVPAAVWLFGSGLAGLGLLKWRGKTRKAVAA